MKIGVDAKWLYDGPVSGKLCVKNLIDSLIENKSINFVLIVKRKDLQKAKEEYEKVCEVIPVPFLGTNFLTNLLVFPFLNFKFNFDYIIFQNFGPLFFANKSVIWIHDLLFLDFPHLYRFSEKVYFRFIIFSGYRSKLIMTASNSEKKRIMRHLKISDSKILVCSCGSDHMEKLKKQKPDSFPLSKNEKYIFYLGRLDIRKNLKLLLQAFSKIEDKKIKLIIGGAQSVGQESKDLKNIISELNIENRVFLTGYIHPNEIKWYFSNAYFFCFPSFAEAFGLPPIEAMSCGCPVICSNTTSMPEICGEAAIYIDPYSVESLAIKLNEVLSSEFDRELFIKKGYQRAKLFKWGSVASSLIKKLNEIK